MQAEREELITEVFVDVMEKLAFMLGEPLAKSELPRASREYIKATIRFSGEKSGELALVVPLEMCVEIAANVLGMDLDDEQVTARGFDALKEVLNVTCGHVLTSVAGEEPIFDLTVPREEKVDRDDWEEISADPDSIGFLVDDFPALLRFSLSE